MSREGETSEVEFSTSAVMAAARESTGLDDWGDDSVWGPALGPLLDSLENEARLTKVGRLASWHSIVARLSQRLLLQQEGFRHLVTDVVDRPSLVIAGLPRTGSTLLQRLLSLDPQTDALRFCDVSAPAPVTRPGSPEDEAKIEHVGRALEQLYTLAPELKLIHEMDPRLPDEEVFLIDLTFMSVLEPLRAHVPSFWSWVMENGDHDGIYRELRSFIAFVGQFRSGGRWVLKAPHHLWMQAQMLEAFPKATVIWTHRDPSRVVPSCASLSHVSRVTRSDRVTPEETGRAWFDMLSDGLQRAVSARQGTEDRFVDVHFQDLMRNPQAAVASIYETAGFDMPDSLPDAIKRYLEGNAKGKHGRHRYTAEDFGISRVEIDRTFGDYVRKFKVATED